MFCAERGGVSDGISRGKHGDVDDVDERNLTIRTLFTSGSGWKLKTDRTCLLSADLKERWVKAVSLVCVNGVSLDFLF